MNSYRYLYLITFSVIASFGTLLSANAKTYILPPNNQSVVGAIDFVSIGPDSTLSDLARLTNVGFNEIRQANPDIDPWLPKKNSNAIIPTQHILPNTSLHGIVINVPEMRLYYFPKSDSASLTPSVMTFPISIGRGNWETPLGKTHITQKKANPNWYPPESIKQEHLADGDPLPDVVPAGPDNPLGQYALRLAIPGYLIHGTNKPYGIGMRVTHGCIRLYPENIEALFHSVDLNLPVNIIHQPYKFGRLSSWAYMESHPMVNDNGDPIFDLKALRNAIDIFNLSLPQHQKINWQDAVRIAKLGSGIPTIVKLDTLSPQNKG